MISIYELAKITKRSEVGLYMYMLKQNKDVDYQNIPENGFKTKKEALEAGADIIMLDNMSINEMKEAVKLINKNAIVEASGNVNLSTVKEIASTGVDIISSSAIVAKAPTLDLGLDCD